MKTKDYKILALAVLCAVSFVITGIKITGEGEALSNTDFLRFHVIANSNTVEDQELKLKVRDRLLKEINIALPDNKKNKKLGLGESRKFVKDNLNLIEKTAKEVIAENGYEYKVKAELGVRWIPEKTYDNVTFPAGNYEALTVSIGEAKGENWWCVLFPPLCLIGTEDMEGKYEPLSASDGKPVKLEIKFKTLELLEK